MLFDDEPALIMASVSSLPGWLELNMIHLPWGLLSAQRFFSTYLVVNHAAVIWAQQGFFPSQVSLTGYFLYLGLFSVSPGDGCVRVKIPVDQQFVKYPL